MNPQPKAPTFKVQLQVCKYGRLGPAHEPRDRGADIGLERHDLRSAASLDAHPPNETLTKRPAAPSVTMQSKTPWKIDPALVLLVIQKGSHDSRR